MMASFDYNYQNPSLFLCFFFVRISAVYPTAIGLQNLDNKEKNKRDSVEFLF